MKKILSILVLSLFLSVQTASAFAHLAIPAWYYGAGALAVGGSAGVYCAMKSGYTATVDIAGDIRRKAGVAWVALSTVSVPTLYEKNVTAKKTYDQVMAVINAKPTTYPNLKAKTQVSDIYRETGVLLGTAASCVGKKVTISGTTYVIGGFINTYSGAASCSINSSTWRISNGYIYNTTFSGCGGEPGTGSVVEHKWYKGSGSTAPVYTPATPAQFSAGIASNGISGEVAEPYQAELDAMMRDDTYIPTFSDDTTGLPFAYPAQPMSPAAVAAYNAQGIAADEREQALTAAQQAAASAVAARDTAVIASQADPTNQALAQKAADATAAAAAASAAAQKVAAENATAAAGEAEKAAEKEADESFSPVTVPGLKTFSWARFADLRGVLATTFPFNLLDRFAVILGAFVRDPVAPSFSLPMYGGNQLSFSLDMFDGIATFFRWAFASIMTIGIVHRIIVFYRGA